jgi:phospholipase C
MRVADFSVLAGAKVLLAMARPLQDIIDRPGVAHEFCNRQAVKILRTDGFDDCADILEQYMQQLNAGVYWADTGWKNVCHYYEPLTGKGLWHFKTALEEFDRYMMAAAGLMQDGKYGKSVFFLGAAAHLAQDLCVPHHARAKLFHGHKEYETWASRNFTSFAVAGEGSYSEKKLLRLWPLHNACQAADMLDMVDSGASESSYFQATQILLPLAQRTTAGLFKQFFDAVAQDKFGILMQNSVVA